MLHELLEAKRREVVDRWTGRVSGEFLPASMPNPELTNHLPAFLDEIISALRRKEEREAGGSAPGDGAAAAAHGEQRLRLGFSLDAVVREYGALRGAIIATALAAGVEPTLDEMQVVYDRIITGIANAVSEYTRRRDAELQHQANEHFAFVAHELRNPLSSATMAFQFLKVKDLLPRDTRIVGALERGLQRTSELIDQTLQRARLASGAELRRERTTLAALIEDVVLGAVVEADSKGIELRVRVDHDDELSLDLRMIRSGLDNLLRNAVKYTSVGSVVELRGGISNGRAVIEIEDRCGGLPPGKVESVFAPFIRLDRPESGFGLGLAIAKQAVDAHGGSIRVQNLPGRGCIFVLELPLAAGKPDPAPLHTHDA